MPTGSNLRDNLHEWIIIWFSSPARPAAALDPVLLLSYKQSGTDPFAPAHRRPGRWIPTHCNYFFQVSRQSKNNIREKTFSFSLKHPRDVQQEGWGITFQFRDYLPCNALRHLWILCFWWRLWHFSVQLSLLYSTSERNKQKKHSIASMIE